MAKTRESIFFDDSDSETEIKTENEYAKNYATWRKKEELHKLKTKYGEDALEANESSSSSDDEDAVELTEQVEKDFFKTLSCLKNKDPKIYDSSVSFFSSKATNPKKVKAVKEQPMFLKDYERNLLLEKGGIVSEDEQDKSNPNIEQESIKFELNMDEDEEEGKWGGFMELRQKTKEENDKEEQDYLQWLRGQTKELKDEDMKSELKPLKDFWNDPELDKEEKFLRDYILKKRYLQTDEDDYMPTYDEIIHDSDNSLSGDEEEIEKQEEFEHKYNFRFEEPDQEFIKRYPRTIEQSLRRTDDKRKQKRAETKQRKKKEKEEKMAEIKKLQELKRKEIEEKIEKLKEVTGATDIAFGNDDLEGDFDPEAHDKRMQALFNDGFYEGSEGDQKPEFPDLDDELEIENWDRWDATQETENEPHYEDDDFNMDADYDPSRQENESKGKKKRRRKSKVAEALNRPKPQFDPQDKNYEKYFDEYYKLECEDIIGDIPCRFKYREVAPNDFGLSVEEILLAKDKELNRWCSLKKMVQRRPDNVEKYDQIAYSRKANNVPLKQRILPSLFSEKPDETSGEMKPSLRDSKLEETPKTKKTNDNEQKKNKRKRKNSAKEDGKKIKKEVDVGISDARLSAFGINPKKFKNKLKYGNKK